MASRRDPLAARIAALDAIAKGEAVPPLAPILAALGDRASLVVAAAARIVKAHHLELALPAVAAALDRHYEATDVQCRAKHALLKTLVDLERATPEECRRAATHVQAEPGWGGSTDSAGPLRILGLEGLVARASPDLYAVLADLLADPLAEVRSAAARIAGDIGGERPGLLLRLRLRLGDGEDPANLGDYSAGLLACAGEEGLPLVADLLARASRASGGPLALALGASRLPAALPLLITQLDRPASPISDADLITAIALHRSDGAARCLLDLLQDDDRHRAQLAAQELRLYRDRSSVMDEVRNIGKRWPDLREFIQDLLPTEPR